MHDDWFDLLIAFNEHGVRHLVVGAHALAVHGVPRATQDLDVWIDGSDENVTNVWAALTEFGAPLESIGVTRDDFKNADAVVQIGLPPSRIDLRSALTGLDGFNAAWTEHVEHVVRGLTVPFLGRTALLTNKRATGRLKDLADLEALGESIDIGGVRPFPRGGHTVTNEMINDLRDEDAY